MALGLGGPRLGRGELGSGDTGSFPAVTADQLRLGGTVLAGLAGAGVGVAGGLAWREFERGEVDIALALGCFALLLSAVMLFLVLQARVVAQLIELREGVQDVGAIERRLLAVEYELSAREEGRSSSPSPEDLSTR